MVFSDWFLIEVNQIQFSEREENFHPVNPVNEQKKLFYILHKKVSEWSVIRKFYSTGLSKIQNKLTSDQII